MPLDPVILNAPNDPNADTLYDAFTKVNANDTYLEGRIDAIDAVANDVLTYDNQAAFPGTGGDGVIYIAKDTNLAYRWDGAAYVQVGAAPLSDADIKTQYENNADTNAFTDAEQSKLTGIEAGAEVNHTAGEMEALVNHNNLLGFVAEEHLDWTADQGATNIHTGNLDTGTSANQLVQLNGSAQLPAVDGSALTGIDLSTVNGNPIVALTGTVQIFLGTNSVIGTGTAFLSEVNDGDAIYINDTAQVISTVNSDTSISLVGPGGADLSGLTAYRDSDLLTVNNSSGIEKFKIDKSGGIYQNGSLVSLGFGKYIGNDNDKDSIAISRDGTALANDDGSDNRNIALGSYALQNATTASVSISIGYQSLQNNTTGSNNIGIGTGALAGSVSSTAYGNIALGSQPGFNITSGNNNILLGNSTGSSLTSGSTNVAIGDQAMSNSTLALRNVCIGYKAGIYNTEGRYNVSIGDEAGCASVIGDADYNVNIGFRSGKDTTVGLGNVTVGAYSGWKVTSGQYNTLIGRNTGVTNLTTGSYNVLIGYGADTDAPTDSNKLRIKGQTNTLIEGDFSTETLTVNGTLTVRDGMDISLATMDKSFITNEQTTLTLSSARSNAVISVAKEIPQIDVTSGNAWNIAYTEDTAIFRDDTTYATTLSINATTGNITLTMGTGTWASGDVTQAVVGNGGIAVIDGTPGSTSITATVIKDFADTSQIASGEWYISPVIIDSNSKLTIPNYSISSAYDITVDNGVGPDLYYNSNSYTFTGPAITEVGVTFYDSGNKMVVFGDVATNQFNFYNLSTPYDISSATYVSSSNSSAGGDTSCQMLFNNDGTKLFKLLSALNAGQFEIVTYNLIAPYDMSDLSSFSSNLITTTSTVGGFGQALSPDGTTWIVGTNQDGRKVYQYTLSAPFDFSTAGSEVSSTVPEMTISNCDGFIVSSDGKNIYFSDDTFDSIQGVTLFTAWDISANSDQRSVNLQSPAVTGNPGRLSYNPGNKSVILFDNTGVTMYELDTKPGFVNEYKTPTNNPYGLYFSNDGTKFYTISLATDLVYQYNMATPWDVTTASDSGNTLNVTTEESTPRGMEFKSDGTYLWAFGQGSNTIYQYVLSTPWDLSTASYDSKSFSVASQDTMPTSMVWNGTGTEFWVCFLSGGTVFKYTAGAPFDVNGSSYSGVSKALAESTDIRTIDYNGDGTKLYILSANNETVYQYTLSTPYDINTAVYDSVSRDLAVIDQDVIDIHFDPTGSRLFALGAIGHVCYINTSFASTTKFTGITSVTTTDAGQIDTTYWTDINSITVNGYNLNGGEMLSAISTDGRTTWLVMSSGLGSRNIVRDNLGTWEYNTNSTFGSETWTAATTNDMLSALSESITVIANKMSLGTLNGIGDVDFPATGNTLDVAIIVNSNNGEPELGGLTVNYDANTLNQGAVLGTDYNYDQPASNKVRITSLTNQNLKIRIV